MVVALTFALTRGQVLVDELSASYKKVDALGPCRHNAEPPAIPPWTTSALLSEQTINWFHMYKFAICFENGAAPGWITEKLIDAYLGLCGTLVCVLL